MRLFGEGCGSQVNVLLTCAGRRNYLISFFREALNGRGLVFAMDVSPYAPALYEAGKAFIAPPVNQLGYLEVLLRICIENQVRLLIPLNDLELPLLARSRERLLEVGTLPVVSRPSVIDTCFDKWATYQFLRDCNLPVPYTCLSLEDAAKALSSGSLAFPLVIKPRWGTASIGIEYVDNYEELNLAYSLVRRRLARTIIGEISQTDPERSVLIQQRLQGCEYGLDVVNDLEGRYAATFVKRKLLMRAGETDRAVTIQDDRLVELGKTIGERLGHVGNLDCDIIVENDVAYVLEMNPRFGGGYPFSHVAGANIPAALIAWANGEQPDPDWLRINPGVEASKCDRLVLAKALD